MFPLLAKMWALFGLVFFFAGSLSSSDTKAPQDVPQDVPSPSEDLLLWMWSSRLQVYSAAALLLAFCFCLQVARRKIIYAEDSASNIHKAANSSSSEKEVHVSGVKIFYGSQTGTAKGFASELSDEVQTLGIPAEVIDMKDYDPDDRLADECVSRSVCVFLLATYAEGRPTDNAEWFCKWLEEASTDFRYGNTFLKGLRYAVFGLGDSAYVGHYNTVGKSVDKWLWMLSAKRIVSRGEGDCNVAKSRNGSVQADFQAWKAQLLSRLTALAKGEEESCSGDCKSEGSCKKTKKKQQHEAEEEKATQQDDSEVDLIESSSEEEESAFQEDKMSRSVVDVEDLGHVMNKVKKAKGRKEDGGDVQMVKLNGGRKSGGEGERREMITPALREALTKQGEAELEERQKRRRDAEAQSSQLETR